MGTRPTLAERRNSLNNGDPIDGRPTGNLLELVNGLTRFARGDYVAGVASLGSPPTAAGRA